MATLYETIRYWAEGQNTLNAREEEFQRLVKPALVTLVNRLRSFRSLADLATTYYDRDFFWQFLVKEFDLAPADAEAARNAAYWQRFMEIRHRSKLRSR